MEERFGQLQCDYRGGRRSSMSMRYPFQEVDDGAPSRHAHYASASTSASPCAPVPLQPWDHQAILDYRNRVNANSNAHAHPRRNDLHHHHYLHMRSAVLLEEADRLRWSRFRDVSRSRSPSPSRIRRQQDYRDWRVRDHQPQFYHHQVCPPSAPTPSPNPNPNPNPNPALEQGGLFRFGAEKRARLEDDDDQFRIRKRSKFLHYEYDYDHPLFPSSAAPPLLAPPPPPPRDMYLPSPRVKWQHDLFEHAHTNIHSMMEERERERERNVVSFGLSIAGGGGGGGGGGFDDFMAVQNDLSKGVEVEVEVEVEEEVEVEDSRRTLTSLLSDLKDQVLASTPSVGGLQQSETRKGKIHIKGQNGNVGNMQSKKLKNKIPSSTQTTQKKVKPKKNPPHSLPAPAPASASVEQRKMLQNGSLSHLLESTSQCEQSSEAKYERSTADLSVVFRRSGMVAQEVVTSLVNNQPDYTGTKSSASKVLIQQEDIEEEEGEIKIVESQNIFFEEKRSEDHQNVGSQSKTKSMKPTSEAISSEKDLIIQGNSVEPPCYLEGLENKIGTTSATQSQERSIPTGNYFSLDCRGNDSPATLKANQSDNGLPSVESLPTCAPLLKLHNDLSINAPSEPNLTSRVMQEVGYQDTPLTLSICKAIEKSDAKERLQKKLKVEQREKLPLYDNIRMEGPLLTSSVLQLHTDVTESQGAITGDQVLLNGTMISNASHQCSGVCQIQSSQAEERMLSQNAILVPTLPQSRLSITCLPTRAKVVASSMLAGRSRTWHRTDNATSSSVLVRPLVIHNDATSGGKEVTKVEKSQSAAYVRKGNSLVRATYPPIGLSSSKSSSARPLNTGKTLTWKSSPLKGILATGDINNVVTGLGTNVGSNRPPSATEFWFSTPAFERPSTPSVVPAFKSPVCSNVSPQSLAPTAVSNTPIEGHVLTTNAQDEDDFKVIYDNIPSVANVLIEHPMHDPLNNLSLCKRNRNEDHLEKAGAAQMIYVKQMSNQLIATPTCKSQGSTASIGEGGQLPPNCLVQDHYFKRKKNQLVRSNLPMDSKITKSLEVPGVSSSLDTELKVTTLKDQRGMTFFQTKLGRVLKQKKHWTLQSSWVWTLGKAESSNAPLLQSRRLAPLLFPWKRPSYGKSGLVGKLKAVPSISKGSSLSLISKKLNCLRKRDTVYTKSLNGFSLHRSGVLSLGGSNLKWSKSIEKRSKQASEEITIAVAAAERKRREVKAVCDVITSASKENAVRQSSKPARGIKQRARKSKQATGERIVQVGLFRYKMDPSKRTLQMIPAEESTSSFNTSLASHTIDTTKPITPKRVSIGGDEYLRVGNGNQLVRDPKKVCRVLASEKVRWSLHTARRRLAKKQQYCQFFTRFGKCNKEDGKCSYIHDREKVAVCTKFLKGACSNANCELTHKIIPERMEDCSYFLQGFCTNENCPYRHVNVNPNAPVCDGFLKGYCAEGDKCNKKHTYVCPQYAATGECPERLSCKLHHPKKKDKPKGSGRHKGCIISKRRYFVADDLGISELASTLFRLHSEQQTTLEFPSRAPECVEFISLDAPEEDVDDNNLICGALSPMKRPETDFLSNIGLPVDDIDMMIKPIRLLQKEQAFNT